MRLILVNFDRSDHMYRGRMVPDTAHIVDPGIEIHRAKLPAILEERPSALMLLYTPIRL